MPKQNKTIRLGLAEQWQEYKCYLGYMGLFKALGKEFLIGEIHGWIFPQNH